MAQNILPVDFVPSRGLAWERVAKIGRLTDGYRMAEIASFINMIGAQRLRVLAQGGYLLASSPAFNSMNARVHTCPNGSRVYGMVIVGNGASSTSSTAYFWKVNNVTCATRYSQTPGSVVAGPNELRVEHTRLLDGGTGGTDLTADTDYDINISTGSNHAIYFYCVYEVPIPTLDASTNAVAVPLDVFQVGAPVLDRDISDAIESAWTVYKRQGTHHFSWASVEGAAPSQTGTTWKNVLDATTTGYGANAAGFYTIPYRQGRQVTSSTVDVVLWARGSVNSGTGGRVRFQNSAGVIGTITGFTTSSTVRTTTATLPTTSSTSDLVIVEHSDSGANTMTTIAAGIYAYLT